MDEIRLIDANALKPKIDKFIGYLDEDMIDRIKVVIDNAPTVEAIQYTLGYQDGFLEGKKIFEKPHGKWEYNQYDGNPNIGNWHCSECRHLISGKYNQYPNYVFCPYCGADMRPEKKVKIPSCLTNPERQAELLERYKEE